MVSEHNEELKTKQFNFQERGKLGAKRMESSGRRQKRKDLISICYFEGRDWVGGLYCCVINQVDANDIHAVRQEELP